MARTWSLALNALNELGPDHQIARAAAREILPRGETKAPEWVHLLPIGPSIDGLDGRHWTMADPAAVAARSMLNAAGETVSLPLDFEHATEVRGNQGLPAPAAAWITALQVRDDGIWGRVDWLAEGRQAVESKSYRYLSPVFSYHRQTLEVHALRSAALTNQPNLPLTALNRSAGTATPTGEPMTPEQQAKLALFLGLAENATAEQIKTKLALSLGLAENATAEQIVQAAQTATAQARAAETPDLTKFVPRGDYEIVLNRAETAEATLATQAAAAEEAKIETAITDALAAGKIAPNAADYHRAQCRSEGGLERFTAYCAAAPAMLDPSGAGGRPPAPNRPVDESPDAVRISELLGVSPEDLAKYGPPVD